MKELRIKRNDPQLSEIQRGGLKAFEMLFRQYYAVLCAYGHKYVDFHDAEEIVQDSLLWIWENRENLIIESSLSSYLFKMVHHKALNKLAHIDAIKRADTRFYEEMQEMIQSRYRKERQGIGYRNMCRTERLCLCLNREMR